MQPVPRHPAVKNRQLLFLVDERLCALAFRAPPFLAVVRVDFLLDVFRGTLAPAARASDRPIAMACSRLSTFG